MKAYLRGSELFSSKFTGGVKPLTNRQLWSQTDFFYTEDRPWICLFSVENDNKLYPRRVVLIMDPFCHHVIMSWFLKCL